MQLCGRELTPSTSVGIAIYPDDARSAADLNKAADAAMYRAKQRGRHTFEFYTPDITAEAMERLAIENDLRRALARGELLLYFQPQVALRSGRILGFEACCAGTIRSAACCCRTSSSRSPRNAA